MGEPINITPEDMAEALNQNQLAMEQAKVAALLRMYSALEAKLEQLESEKEPAEADERT